MTGISQFRSNAVILAKGQARRLVPPPRNPSSLQHGYKKSVLLALIFSAKLNHIQGLQLRHLEKMKSFSSVSTLLPLALLAGKTLAVGCAQHTFGVCQDNIVHWYDPDDGQICDPHDCGGGRAPPRKDVPGCAFYTGTETLRTEASYMPCFTSGKLVLTTEEPTPTGSSSVPLVTTLTTSTSAVITDGPSLGDEDEEVTTPTTTTATGNGGSVVGAGGSLVRVFAGAVFGVVAFV
ncbi:hypothetical protein QC761_606210 [Podospora bellae-mahoneyi]|uniref:Uncharacterized protein n=1 Tax=Podospora bellae-mahoneyi TaxID=2093777 RepID=A0ABR0FC93_9PEZI|nr:hypothetical protein QC761_606210 [Podospora bellae-mahoneyi]